MADNTTLNPGTGGDVIATDDIAGAKHQQVKIEFGTDGVATPVSASNPLPISVIGGVDNGHDQPLTDTQLRATAVPVSGTVAVSGTIPVSGTVAVSGTIPVSGPLTDAQLRASALPISGAIRAADSPSIDAFSRWRTSSANYVFDTNFEYTLQPLIFEAVTAQTGATVTHDATNRNALMTTSATPASGAAYMQTYEHFRYQSGRSQLILTTFNFIETDANTLKFIGYSNGSNGVELQQSGSTVQLVLLSDTAKGDETVVQTSWNLDPMDGTGPSGITLDLTKTHILVIDLQWLGVGRVRCGFDIDGIIYYVHQFIHANLETVAYMQTANLPIRAGMTCTGASTTTMRFICASVSSEGGQTNVGGYGFSQQANVTAGNGTATHLLSLRPKTTFNSISNRSQFVLESVDILVTGSSPIRWSLCIGQAISGTTTFNDVNATYSGMEYNILGTVSGSPAIVVTQGYVAATAQNKGSISRDVSTKYPITLNQAGAIRTNGTLTLLVTGIGGASAVRGILNWREIR